MPARQALAVPAPCVRVPAWVAWAMLAASGAALVLASAKAHGREVRLLREAHGVMEVDFRRGNGPVVEGIWRTDRRTFWPAFGLLAAAGVAGGLAAGRPGTAAMAAPCAFAAAFLVAGLAAWARRERRFGAQGGWGSFGWWSLVLALWTMAAWAARAVGLVG